MPSRARRAIDVVGYFMRTLKIESHRRLLERIEDDARRKRVRKLLQLCMGSLGALARLDAAIFERRQRAADGRGLLELLTDAEKQQDDDVESIDQLRSLAEIVWGPGDAISQVVQQSFGPFMPEEDDDELDFDAAFADDEVTVTDEREESLDDILDALNDQSEIYPASDAELAQATVPLTFALRSHVDTAKRRLDAAIAEGRLRQALHDIDESRRETTEAIFALVEAVFRAHKLHPDRATILPGFLSDLEQALQIRREFAFVHRFVRDQNQIVQDAHASPGEREVAFEAVSERLDDLLAGEVFRHMRASDRFELLAFQEQLEDADAQSGRLVIEGFTKYLESLGAVNQREVIVRHDHAVMGAVRTHIDSARTLFELSPDAAREVAETAFTEAERLLGWIELLDELIATWREKEVQERAREDVQELLGKLSTIIPSG